MCVIMTSLNQKPTNDQLEAGWKQNPWGAGVAWIDRSNPKKPVTRWKKGILDVEDVKQLVASIPGPEIVVHFRIPTEGLEDIELTHPFPIDATAANLFEGSTPGKVLFHNGGWAGWRPFTLKSCARWGQRLPKGMLNDSRMMAWNAHLYGEEVLQLINERAIVFGLNEDGSTYFQMYGPEKQGYATSGWYFIGDRQTENGVWFSNDLWEKHLPKAAPEPHRYTTLRDIKTQQNARKDAAALGGDRHDPSFRPIVIGGGRIHVSGRDAEQEQVEGSEADTGSRSESVGKSPSALNHSPAFVAAMRRVHGDDPEKLARALALTPETATRRTIGYITAGSPVVH